MTIDQLLEKIGWKYDDLKASEREVVYSWLEVLDRAQVGLDDVKGYISAMRDAVENELTKPNLGKQEDLFLKARLRNYMLLEAFLSGPEKARKRLERQLASTPRPPEVK